MSTPKLTSDGLPKTVPAGTARTNCEAAAAKFKAATMIPGIAGRIVGIVYHCGQYSGVDDAVVVPWVHPASTTTKVILPRSVKISTYLSSARDWPDVEGSVTLSPVGKTAKAQVLLKMGVISDVHFPSGDPRAVEFADLLDFAVAIVGCIAAYPSGARSTRNPLD